MNVVDIASGYSVWSDWTPNRTPSGITQLRYIVQHTTEGGLYNGGDGALSSMMNPNAQASAHYLVKTDGTIIRLAPEYDACWHAGWTYSPSAQCFYDAGQQNPNTVSIGIENAGYRDRPLTAAQLQANAELVRDIFARYGPLPVIQHSELSTGGTHVRTDPGALNFVALMQALAGGDYDMDGDTVKELIREMLREQEGADLVKGAIKWEKWQGERDGYGPELDRYLKTHFVMKPQYAKPKPAKPKPARPKRRTIRTPRAHVNERGPVA